MGKGILILGVLLLGILIFSSFSLAIECSSNKDCNDGKKYTKDICINPGKEESFCVHEISNSQLQLLNLILEKITELVDKVWIINVEPNITVTPEIIVNPNITLPDKECKWEKLNQEIELNLSGLGASRWFILPKDVQYSEIKFNKINSFFLCNNYPGAHAQCKVIVNDQVCYSSEETNSEILINLCNESFIGGGNWISLQGANIKYISLNKLYIEMEVKPANC